MNIKKILLIIAGLISMVGIVDLYNQNKNPSLIKAYGNLIVNFHSVLPGNTIFDINNFLPGQSTDKNIDVKNEGNTTEVFVKGVKKSGNTNPKLENVMDIKITQGSNVLYSKNLKNFLESDKISLGTINKNKTKVYNFKITFQTSAGNEYQAKSVKFDLDFSSAGDVKGDHDEYENHDDHNDDHNHNRWDDVRDFGNKCKSAFEKVFKFGHR